MRSTILDINLAELHYSMITTELVKQVHELLSVFAYLVIIDSSKNLSAI